MPRQCGGLAVLILLSVWAEGFAQNPAGEGGASTPKTTPASTSTPTTSTVAAQFTAPVIVAIIVSMCFGGLAGAALTQVVQSYRNKLQHVAYRMEYLFSSHQLPAVGGASPSISINYPGANGPIEFARIHVCEVEIVNRTNRDFGDFRFGVTLPKNGTIEVLPI